MKNVTSYLALLSVLSLLGLKGERTALQESTHTSTVFFKGEMLIVCKPFYLGTLDISQKPIYTAHDTKNKGTNTPGQDQRGKSLESRRKPEEIFKFV